MTTSTTKDIFKGDCPPPNTPYHVILKFKGRSYLRGWITCDKQIDPKGHHERMCHYQDWQQKKES